MKNKHILELCLLTIKLCGFLSLQLFQTTTQSERIRCPAHCFEGNKKQYKLNRDVLDKIDRAKNTSDDESRTEFLEEGEQLLLERNKHICLADKYRWDTVECYAAEPLASNSGDKKRIKKAIKESKQLREEKQKAAAAKWKPKKSPQQLGIDGPKRVVVEKARTIEWWECRLTCHMTLNSCVFAAVETTITPGEVQDGARAKGNRLEVNSDAVNFPPEENVHNGYLEFENVDFACSMVVKGRLKENISFWQNIGISRWVLHVLQEGYSLPFISLPQEVFFKNHPSAVKDNVFVCTEMSKLLLSGAVVEVKREDLTVCNPLGIVRNSAQKRRLIMDLRYVNQYLRLCKFKYDDIRTAADLFHKDDWFFKFDYKSGYHHIEIFPQHCKYLGFSLFYDGQLRFFKFMVLPFGLSTGPYLFTKIQGSL